MLQRDFFQQEERIDLYKLVLPLNPFREEIRLGIQESIGHEIAIIDLLNASWVLYSCQVVLNSEH